MRAKLPLPLIPSIQTPIPSRPLLFLPILIPHHHNHPPFPSPSSKSPLLLLHRTLTTTPPSLSSNNNNKKKQKGGKQDSKRTVPHNAAILQSQSQSPDDPIDAFDFSEYKAAIARAHERLKLNLGRAKAGSAETIEEVRVFLGKKGGGGGEDDGSGSGNDEGGKKKKKKGGENNNNNTKRESVKLGDLASVVARGRNVEVLVGEKEHLKPILSSLATLPPPLSYTPPTTTNTSTSTNTSPLTITIPIPPPTASSRIQAHKDAEKKGEEALFALREARAAQRKRHRRMELGRLVGPDELFRAEREVERMNEGAVGEARGIVEGWRRVLESG